MFRGSISELVQPGEQPVRKRGEVVPLSIERVDDLPAFFDKRVFAGESGPVLALNQVPGVAGGAFVTTVLFDAPVEIGHVDAAIAATVAVDQVLRGIVDFEPLGH